MSKVAIQGNASGTGTFTIAAPNSNTDRTLTLPDEAGTVLTSASSIAQNSGPLFIATRNATQSISSATYTKIEFSTEEIDTDNCYDPTTNYRFTPTVAGYYLINVTIEANATSYTSAHIYKNGSIYRGFWASNPSVGASAAISSLVYLNGSTDYVEAYTYQNNTSNLYNNNVWYEFSGYLVRSA